MSTNSPDVSVHSLLAHEPFVRAVARGLLADEHDAADAVQETWLRALTRTPPSFTSIRGWLGTVAANVARDHLRRRERKEVHERGASQAESVEAAQEHLVVQREVVDAVLALEDPYRAVVLMRYYQGLTPSEIATRLDQPAGTVRSQVSRAHALLRERLDREVDGGRAAWIGALAPLAAKKSVVTGAALALSALIAGAVIIQVALAWQSEGAEEVAALKAGVGNSASRLVDPMVDALHAASTRSGAERSPAIGLQASGPGARALLDLDALEPKALLEFAVQIRRQIGSNLLTPAAEHLEGRSSGAPDEGVVRLVDRMHRSPLVRAILKREHGAFYSFETRDHSYDAHPDVGLGQGQLSSGFGGYDVGMLLRIGDVPLSELPTSRSGAIPPLEGRRAEAWDFMWQRHTLDALEKRELNQTIWDLGISRAAVDAGVTYIVRSIRYEHRDQLVGIRVLEVDEMGCTFAWRRLKDWPIDAERNYGYDRAPDERPDIGPGPGWLAELENDELLSLLDDVRNGARAKLLDVPSAHRERWERLVEDDQTRLVSRRGFVRILERGQFEPLFDFQGGGAYYSFHRGSHHFQDDVDLGLSGGWFNPAKGLLLDIGEVASDRLETVMNGVAPARLSRDQRRAWEMLETLAPVVDGRRRLEPEDEEFAREMNLSRGMPAVAGHTYLLRCALGDTHDHLVVFTSIGADEYGHTLVWRELRSFAVERPR